ncbi:MAG TPA: DegT/DnrJ/EryC1/StrS family aminotransferase, partial [Terriglobales bacterium]|nr:DegT/DnrJ/EryC1/StrS family aminotransferase [Terriglobales bacterium]
MTAKPTLKHSNEPAVSAPWPHFEAEEIDAAAAVLRSGKVNYWTGQEGRLFEAEFAEATGAKHAICVANGTLALELALHALGIGQGDEVITTSRTFIASASCVVMRG